MLINISRELCIGAAPCVAIAGDVFQMDDEGKAILVGPNVDDATTQLAAEACPVRAIFLYEDNKTQTYPDPAESPRAYEVEPNSEPTPTAAPATTPTLPAANTVPSGTPVPDPAVASGMPQVIENKPLLDAKTDPTV